MTSGMDRLSALSATPLWVGVLFLLFGKYSSELHAQDEARALKERFEGEAPKAWDKYKTRAKQLQGVMLFHTFSLAPERKLAREERSEFKQKTDRALYLYQSLPAPQNSDLEGTVQAINPDYAFRIRRQAVDTPWVLTELIPRTSTDGRLPDPVANIERWTTSPVTFSSVWHEAPNVVQEAGYKSTGFFVVEVAGQRCIKVQFSYSPDGKNPRIPAITGYSVYSPEEYWVAKEHNVAMKWAARPEVSVKKVIKLEYVQSADGFPIINRIVEDYRLDAETKNVHREFQAEFDLAEQAADDEAFTLSAYGLPEPPRTWKSLYYWIAAFAVIGVACLALSTLIRWRKRLPSSAELTQEQNEKPHHPQ